MSKNIDTIVGVHLDELVGSDLESFLDLLEELVLADLDEEERYNKVLTDINYEKADLPGSDSIGIGVTGILEEMS